MMNKPLSTLVLALLFTNCNDSNVKEITIPVPITHQPMLSEQGILLSGATVKNNNTSAKTGFSILGFSPTPGPYLSSVILSDSTSTNLFFTTLQENRLESNKTYFVRSYIEFGNQKIFGNEVTFTTEEVSQRSIDSVVPNSGKANDIIEINGQNFVLGFTTVTLERHTRYFLEIISLSKTKIIAKIPITEAGDSGYKDITVITSLYGLEEEWLTKTDCFLLDP